MPGQIVKSNSAINGFEYNLSKIISEIKKSEAYSSIVNGSGIVPDWNSLIINESRRLSSDLLVLKLYIPNTSRRGLALLITCIINSDSNIVRGPRIIIIPKAFIENNYNVSIDKARELLADKNVLASIYNDPRVKPVLESYNISIQRFIENFSDDPGLTILENGTTFLLIQVTLIKVNINNRTEYLLESEYYDLKNKSLINKTCPPTIDALSIYFVNNGNTIKIIKVELLNNLPPLICMRGAIIKN